jgi:hypothetical protein
VITSRQFTQRVGHKPRLDDLQRCNCPLAGQILHMQCGLNRQGMPMFMGANAKRRRVIECKRIRRTYNRRPSPGAMRRWALGFRITRLVAKDYA